MEDMVCIFVAFIVTPHLLLPASQRLCVVDFLDDSGALLSSRPLDPVERSCIPRFQRYRAASYTLFDRRLRLPWHTLPEFPIHFSEHECGRLRIHGADDCTRIRLNGGSI
ncbi:hypothetical protein B0H11DRAFT_2094398 [Mycena galericulata]|nr:hypothetical protein B0H11DRAFT_2094398 [Mycena galericulata]